MVLIPENFDQVTKLAKLGARIGVDYLQIKQCSDTEYKELGINPKEYHRVIKDLKKAEELSGDRYNVTVKWNKINILGDTDVYKKGFRNMTSVTAPLFWDRSAETASISLRSIFRQKRFCMGDIHKTSYYDIVKATGIGRSSRILSIMSMSTTTARSAAARII